MNIYITNIKIYSIANIGSLNIGKTILCHNKASFSSYQTQGGVEPPSIGLGIDGSGGLHGLGSSLPGPDIDIPR